MDGKIVQDFSQLRVLPINHTLRSTHSSNNRRSLLVEIHRDDPNPEETTAIRMDSLVQDLNSALEESTKLNDVLKAKDLMKQQGGGQQYSSHTKRRAWRRRCKSTSNLAAIIPGNGLERRPSNISGIKDTISKSEVPNPSTVLAQNNSDLTGNMNFSDNSYYNIWIGNNNINIDMISLV